MTTLRRRLAKLFHLTWQDRWLLFETYILLGLARLAINIIPLRRLAPWIGAQAQETPAEISRAHLCEAERSAWAVRTGSRYTRLAEQLLPPSLHR